MSKIIVLVTTGRNSSVNTVTVRLFDTVKEAIDFVATYNSAPEKYWQAAGIVYEGETLELMCPDFL